MRKIITLSPAIALAFMLGGCPLGGDGTDALVKQFMDGMAAKCSWAVPVANATQIVLAATGNGVVNVGALVTSACSAVMAKAESKSVPTLKDECPKVEGVCIEGNWIKEKTGE